MLERCQTTAAMSSWSVVLVFTCAVATAAAEKLDQRVVNEKIQALGLRDDSLPHDQQPRIWLGRRREEVFGQLLAGLSAPKHRVAAMCLEVLRGTGHRKEVLTALLDIAASKKHPIHDQAMMRLCDFGGDARARKFLAAAAGDAARFPDPRHRATLAVAAGMAAEAVAILAPVVEGKSEYEALRAVRQLAGIQHPSAIGVLVKASKNKCWRVAAQAYLALGKVDPKGHPLTADQVTLLTEAGRAAKAGREYFVKRQKRLAGLNREETRPFVMQMLACKDYYAPSDAVGILRTWKDKAALGELTPLMQGESRWRAAEVAEAYMVIDGGEQSIDEVAALVRAEKLPAESLLRAVCRGDMPDARKLTVLRRIRGVAKSPRTVPQSLASLEGDVAPLLGPLMAEEKDFVALAAYAKIAGRDKKRRFAEQLTRALEMAALEGRKPAARGPNAQFRYAAQIVLDACAAHAVAGSGRAANELLDSSHPEVCLSAARLAAKFGGDRARAVRQLYRALGSSREYERSLASTNLADVPIADGADRQAREKTLLGHLGKPSEDYALRLLPTCGTEAAVTALAPLLDDEDVVRAVHAAWVLAQLSDKAAREKGLRRLALYAMFHHNMYQQGSGIDFHVAKEVYFHQTGSMRPGAYAARNQPVQIPTKLLAGFQLDQAEQRFAVRAYQHVQRIRPFSHFGMQQALALQAGPRGKATLDKTHVPLLRIIAADDVGLEVLHVKGERVAHFPARKLAAQAVARITGQPATYVGIDKAKLDSAAFPPGPYTDQTRLVAAFLLDRIQAAALIENPSTDIDWRPVNVYNGLLMRLTQPGVFGEELKQALLAESRRRGIDQKLKAARLAVWR